MDGKPVAYEVPSGTKESGFSGFMTACMEDDQMRRLLDVMTAAESLSTQ